MNDFTKKELQDIFTCVHSFKLGSIRGGFNYYDALNDKIKSMIDNYCEHECKHESDSFDYFKIGEDELLMDVLKTRQHQLKCSKCQRIYDDNQ